MNNQANESMIYLIFILSVLAIIVAIPLLIIFVINGLAESGGAAFRLDYSLWNWFLCLLLGVIVNGGSAGKK